MLQAWTRSNQNSIQPCGGNHCDDVDVGKWREISASRRLAGLLDLESRNPWSELASHCCSCHQHKDLKQSKQGTVSAALAECSRKICCSRVYQSSEPQDAAIRWLTYPSPLTDTLGLACQPQVWQASPKGMTQVHVSNMPK